jgi:threonine dehydratase
MGLEIMQQVKDLDYLVVPAGGGGLVAGLALVAKEVRDSLYSFDEEGSWLASHSLQKR